jgi:hypothetical protein
MKKLFISFACSTVCVLNAQQVDCRTSEAMQYVYDHDAKAKLENEEFEKFTAEFIKHAQKTSTTGCYVIPVVFHVYGTVQSGYAINIPLIYNAMNRLNTDYHGLNNDYNTVNNLYQGIKACMPDITFALAQKDPSGNATNGIVFHSTASGFGNSSGYDAAIAADAWDNYKYMNIYVQNDLYNDMVYTNSGIAWYPNSTMSNNNTARIVYNGAYLASNTTAEFASTLTHEYGHWLNLIHTFQGGCVAPNDNVSDTPECDFSAQNYTCHASASDTYPMNCFSVTINAENYMDYAGAYGCYKMFTAGQVARVYAALQHPSRFPLWQTSNLVAVGLASLCSTAGVASVENEPFQLGVYPNAASENITMLCSDIGGAKIYHITDQLGRVVLSGELNETTKTIQISQLQPAVYYFNVEEKGKLLATRRIIKY